MKIIKRIVVSCLVILVIAIAAIVTLIFTVDPNLLKPTLQDTAAERGLNLNIEGDINWKLFPSLGLSLGAIQLSDAKTNQAMAAIEQTQVSVQLLPLLKQQIHVDGIELRGLKLFYTVQTDGSDLWAALASSESPPETQQPETTEGVTPELAINQVRIQNSTLVYSNQQTGDKAEVSIVKLNANGVKIDGTPFAVDLEVKAAYNDLPPLQLNWNNSLSINLASSQLKIPQGQLDIKAGNAQLSLNLNTDTTWAPSIQSTGTLELSPFDLPALLTAFAVEPPQTSNPKALTKVGANIAYRLTDDQVNFSAIDIAIDKFELKGNASISHFSKPKIRMNLAGTTLSLDDYLAPTSESSGTTSQAQSAPTPLPMQALKDLDLQAKIVIQEMIYSDLPLTNNQLEVAANNGLIELKRLFSNITDGTLEGKGKLDVRSSKAQLALAIKANKIDLGTLMQAMADLNELKGKATADLAITSHGLTDQDLIDNLIVIGKAESENLRITPFNVEQQFCKAIALLQQSAAPQYDWPQQTELEPVKMQFNLANNNLKLEHLSAEISHLKGAADGSINLNKGTFNIPLSLSIGDFAGDIEGCLPIKDKWRKRELPIRCKGNLDNIGAKTCLPDTKLIKNILKDKAKAKAKEKTDAEKARAEKKAKQKARELLKEQLGNDEAKEVEDTLRGLFKQLKK